MAVRRTTIVSGFCLCAASLWLIAGSLPRSAAAEIPEPVRQALESNARSLSPITIAWERTRTSDLPRSRAMSLLAGQSTAPSALFLPQKWRFLWDNGRFYTHLTFYSMHLKAEPDGRSTELTEEPPDEMRIEVTFDGQKRYCGTKSPMRAASEANLAIDTPTNLRINQPRVTFLQIEFFDQAGFHIPGRTEDYEAKRPAKSLPLYLIEQGASVIEVGREEVDGVSCMALVLRSGTAENRFVLDPAKGYAVRRRIEKTPPGGLAVRSNCSDFAQVPGSGLWMPRKVEVEWHTWPGVLAKPVKEAVIRETFRVSELKSEPIPPEQFVLKYNEAGTTIADSTIEGKKDSDGWVVYRVPADPSRLDEVIKAAASGQKYEPTIVSFRKYFILVNVLLFLILIGVVWWRARRKSR